MILINAHLCSPTVQFWIETVDSAGPLPPFVQLEQFIDDAPDPDHPLNHYLQGMRDARFMLTKLKIKDR